MAGGAAAIAAAADAWVVEPRWIDVVRSDIVVKGLGSGWQGATIALMSDTHCGPFVSQARIEHAVSLANDLRPDLVLLLGDYVHRGERHIDPGIEPFGRLRASQGVYAVLGNHDHWDGRDRTLAALKRAGIPAMVNRGTTLVRGGDSLAVGGVGDFMEDLQEPGDAFRGVGESTPRILMSHNPDYAEQLPGDVRVDLMVCGHTHGGQVRLPGYGAPVLPSRYGQKYERGLVQGPNCRVYVTRGVGTISPPVRFLCRPELTLLTLVG